MLLPLPFTAKVREFYVVGFWASLESYFKRRSDPSTVDQIKEQLEYREAKPKLAVICPKCGATTMPNAGGCCEYCGGAVNG